MLAHINLDISCINNPQEKFVYADLSASPRNRPFGDQTGVELRGVVAV